MPFPLGGAYCWAKLEYLLRTFPHAPGGRARRHVTWIYLLLGLGLLLLPLVRSMRRATELFRLKLRGGEIHFVRGRIPHGLLQDLGDVARASQIERADVWALRRDGRAELHTRGELTPEQLQRLRNVVGSYSLQRILAGGRPRRGSRR
jgi:hypothetical protein